MYRQFQNTSVKDQACGQLVTQLCPLEQDAEEQDLYNRKGELFDHMDWTESLLSEREEQQLGALIIEYSDVFALNNLELGSTNLVHHVVDTGNKRPCRQPIRKIPICSSEG